METISYFVLFSYSFHLIAPSTSLSWTHLGFPRGHRVLNMDFEAEKGHTHSCPWKRILIAFAILTDVVCENGGLPTTSLHAGYRNEGEEWKGQELELGAEEKREAEEELLIALGFPCGWLSSVPSPRVTHCIHNTTLSPLGKSFPIYFFHEVTIMCYYSNLCITRTDSKFRPRALGQRILPRPQHSICELPVHLKIISIESASWKFVLSIVFDKH